MKKVKVTGSLKDFFQSALNAFTDAFKTFYKLWVERRLSTGGSTGGLVWNDVTQKF